MPLKSVSLTKTTKHALKCEQHKDAQGNPTGEPIEGATLFELRPLSARLLAHVKDQATEFRPDHEAGDGAMKASFLPHKSALETVRIALVGWENLVDDNDQPVQFKTHNRNVAGKELAVATTESLDTSTWSGCASWPRSSIRPTRSPKPREKRPPSSARPEADARTPVPLLRTSGGVGLRDQLDPAHPPGWRGDLALSSAALQGGAALVQYPLPGVLVLSRGALPGPRDVDGPVS